MGEALLITSGRGGVGKSVIAVNVAAGLARLGYNVALVDGCTGMRSLDIMLGLENRAIYDLQDLAEGICAARQALMSVEGIEHLHFLNAPPLTAPYELGAAAFTKAIERVSFNHRYVVIDGPSGVDTGFEMALKVCRKAVVVTQADDPVALRACERVTQAMRSAGQSDIKLILNKARPETPDEDGEYPCMNLARRLDMPLVGQVPEDEVLRHLPPLAQAGTALGRMFEDIARRVSGENMRLWPLTAQPVRKRWLRG